MLSKLVQVRRCCKIVCVVCVCVWGGGNIRENFLRENINAPSPVRAKFRCRVGVGQ